MKNQGLWLVLFLAFQHHFIGQDRNLESLQILKLQCENAKNTSQTGSNTHKFSWIAASTERGERKTAYQLEVASTPEKPMSLS